MYLLVLAFTFVNCYCLMILCLHLLSLFTYYIQVPFLNQINKIFKLPYFLKISLEKLDEKTKDETEDEKTKDETEDEDEETEDEETEDEETEDEETEDEETEDKETKDKETKDKETKDKETINKELYNKLTNIEDFIKIKKNKFLIDESLD